VLAIRLTERVKGVSAAIDLARKGIGKIPADKNLFALYQFAAELLARDPARLGEAVALLKDGIDKIPVRHSGYKLAESLLLLAVKAGRRDWLEEFISQRRAEAPHSPQICLAEVLLQALAGDWEGATRAAARGRDSHTGYLALFAQEAYAWLAAGRPEEARAALVRYPRDIDYRAGSGSTWLACFIALRNGDVESATQLYAVYRDEATAAPTQQDLLEAWNSPIPFSTPHPAHVFPILPPALSGLEHTVIRPPNLEPVAFDPQPAVPVPAPESARCGLDILVLATEWRSGRGGLSTFNRQLCLALARAGQRVACAVPACTRDEAEQAATQGVTLIPAPAAPGAADPNSGLSRRLALPVGFRPAIIIGHGRITGPAAQVQRNDFFPDAQRLHFIHMAPGEIEWLKGKEDAAIQAEARENIERDLSSDAALVVAVGPRLEREFGTVLAGLRRPPPFRFDPGFSFDLETRSPPSGIECLVLGRAEDLTLKGLDIAARALGLVIRDTAGKLEASPVLVVRGAPAGTGTELQKKLEIIAENPSLRIRVREYTAEAETIEQDLLRASLVLMPSRSEGFGLVAMEALEVGTPLLASAESGFAECLREKLPSYKQSLYIVAVTGDLETDAAAWAREIEMVLRNRSASFAETLRLAERLAGEWTWGQAVQALLAHLATL
jgi:glycosyltransferase involved in cell wall biosynthesis